MISSSHLLVLALILSCTLCQFASSTDVHARHFVVHMKPDCSDYGQIDTVGEDFMYAPQFWEYQPINSCFMIPEPHEINSMLWARFLYRTSPTWSELHLQWYYPSNECDIYRFDNTLRVTYDVEVNTSHITCAPAVMTEWHADFNTSTTVYLTITNPTREELPSTGGFVPTPEEDINQSTSSLSPIAICLIIGFTIVGVLAIVAACYVWRWKQLRTWEHENQQRLMTTRFGMTSDY